MDGASAKLTSQRLAFAPPPNRTVRRSVFFIRINKKDARQGFIFSLKTKFWYFSLKEKYKQFRMRSKTNPCLASLN